jgi:hypothetical protein
MIDNEADYWNNRASYEHFQHEIYMQDLGYSAIRPSTVYKPKLYIDGNMWCALFGENIQDGVAGFGKSPEEAMADFDKKWVKKIEEVQK